MLTFVCVGHACLWEGGGGARVSGFELNVEMDSDVEMASIRCSYVHWYRVACMHE